VGRHGVPPYVTQRLKAGTPISDRADYVQEIAGRSRQPIEPGHHQNVAFVQALGYAGKLLAVGFEPLTFSWKISVHPEALSSANCAVSDWPSVDTLVAKLRHSATRFFTRFMHRIRHWRSTFQELARSWYREQPRATNSNWRVQRLKLLGPVCLPLIAGSNDVVSPKATTDAIAPAFLFLAACELAALIAIVSFRHAPHGKPMDIS
jgi:hypothetical protein